MKWQAIKMGNTRHYWQIEDEAGNVVAEIPSRVADKDEKAELISQLPVIVDTAKKLLSAMEQKDFVVNGYANGSASISEAKEAIKKEHEMYIELWDLIK